MMSEVKERKGFSLISTSREPSPRTRSLIKDLAALSSNLIRVTRGKMTFQELIAKAFHIGAKTLVIVGEKKGNPSIIRIYDTEPIWLHYPPVHIFTIFLRGVSLTREVRGKFPVRPLDRAYVIAETFYNEIQRNICLALARMFSATMTSSKSMRDGLVINVTNRGNIYTVSFKYSGSRVGPLLRVREARVVGRPIEKV